MLEISEPSPPELYRLVLTAQSEELPSPGSPLINVHRKSTGMERMQCFRLFHKSSFLPAASGL